MNKLISLTTFLMIITFTCNCQKLFNDHDLLLKSLPEWSVKQIKNVEKDSIYKIADFLNPFYFEEDFNGDNLDDIAVCIVELKTQKKGILIHHRNFPENYIIGAGHKFGNGGDNLDWIHFWRINKNLNRNVTVIHRETGLLEMKKLMLTAPCLFVKQIGSSSGLVYWTGERYLWAQQGE